MVHTMTGRVDSRSWVALVLSAALLEVVGPGAFGQAGALPATKATTAAAASDVPAEAYVATMTFDVASVRESKVDLAQGMTVSGGWEKESSVFRANNFSFYNLLSVAYSTGSHYDVKGIPDAMNGAFFNIQAKGDAEADAKLAESSKRERGLERQHMMQTLLADRFRLKTHWETNEGKVYNLVVVKRGKLEAAKNTAPSDEELKRWGDRPIPALYQGGSSTTAFDYIAHGCSVEDILEMLASQFGRPVINKTELSGKYDFTIRTHETKNSQRRDDDTSPYPTLEDAIQDDLGLKLVPAKGPVPMLVIDHAEMPSEN
jgi:uncharacterized protein (TIGR03435 family)